MVVEYKTLISSHDLFAESVNKFLIPFQNIINQDISTGMSLPFDLIKRNRYKVISPIVQLAQPHDAKTIVDIYLDIYKGTYPYKEIENVNEVRRMVQNPNYRWLLFRHPDTYNTLGCFTYYLDFKNKRGYMRGFNVPPKYQGVVDSMKALIGSMIGIWSQLKDKIYIWYCENRTFHTSSQYLANVCGIKPIALLPNKDMFFNRVESDLMQITYDSRVLRECRNTKTPRIIPEVKRCFDYSNKRYDLGKVDVCKPDLDLDLERVKNLKKKINISVQKLRFDYYTIIFSFDDSDAYFKFLYTPRVNNLEKTEYKVNSLEELFVFVWKLKILIYTLKVRYCEVLVSAYKPSIQQLFYNVGLRPRGYIPSWKYNPSLNDFKDYIMFNWFNGIIENLRLIPEAKDIIDIEIKNKII